MVDGQSTLGTARAVRATSQLALRPLLLLAVVVIGVVVVVVVVVAIAVHVYCGGESATPDLSSPSVQVHALSLLLSLRVLLEAFLFLVCWNGLPRSLERTT